MWSLIYYCFIRWFIKNRYEIAISEHLFFITLCFEIISIYYSNIYYLIPLFLLITNSVTDYINHDVYSVFNIVLVLYAVLILKPGIESVLISLIVPLILYLLNKLYKGMGQGDIELFIALSFYFDIVSLVKILLISSLLNLLYAAFVHKESYCFVPFITIATIMVFIGIIP